MHVAKVKNIRGYKKGKKENSKIERKNAMPKINIKKIPLKQTQIRLKTNQILSMQKSIDVSNLINFLSCIAPF